MEQRTISVPKISCGHCTATTQDASWQSYQGCQWCSTLGAAWFLTHNRVPTYDDLTTYFANSDAFTRWDRASQCQKGVAMKRACQAGVRFPVAPRGSTGTGDTGSSGGGTQLVWVWVTLGLAVMAAVAYFLWRYRGRLGWGRSSTGAQSSDIELDNFATIGVGRRSRTLNQSFDSTDSNDPDLVNQDTASTDQNLVNPDFSIMDKPPDQATASTQPNLFGQDYDIEFKIPRKDSSRAIQASRKPKLFEDASDVEDSHGQPEIGGEGSDTNPEAGLRVYGEAVHMLANQFTQAQRQEIEKHNVSWNLATQMRE